MKNLHFVVRPQLATCNEREGGGGVGAPVLVNELFLSVPPHTRRRLLVVGGVPVTVEQDKAVCSDQIQATTAGCGCVTKEGKRMFSQCSEALEASYLLNSIKIRTDRPYHCSADPQAFVASSSTWYLQHQIEVILTHDIRIVNEEKISGKHLVTVKAKTRIATLAA